MIYKMESTDCRLISINKLVKLSNTEGVHTFLYGNTCNKLKIWQIKILKTKIYNY